MRQALGGDIVSVPTALISGFTNGVPADATAGADMTSFHGQINVYKYLLTVELRGGGATAVTVFGKRGGNTSLTKWGQLGDTGNLGVLGGQPLPTNCTYDFVVEDVGGHTDLLLGLDAGGATVTAEIREYLETSTARAD